MDAPSPPRGSYGILEGAHFIGEIWLNRLKLTASPGGFSCFGKGDHFIAETLLIAVELTTLPRTPAQFIVWILFLGEICLFSVKGAFLLGASRGLQKRAHFVLRHVAISPQVTIPSPIGRWCGPEAGVRFFGEIRLSFFRLTAAEAPGGGLRGFHGKVAQLAKFG